MGHEVAEGDRVVVMSCRPLVPSLNPPSDGLRGIMEHALHGNHTRAILYAGELAGVSGNAFSSDNY